ncbi:MAG: hypothetical protein QM759_14745 [Terricaulis sp.]
MRLPDPRKFPAFAQAQLWGLMVGFALAWLATDKWHISFWGMLVGLIASWLGWELFFGKTAPVTRSDIRAIAYGIFTGLCFPWIGIGFAAVMEVIRP